MNKRRGSLLGFILHVTIYMDVSITTQENNMKESVPNVFAV